MSCLHVKTPPWRFRVVFCCAILRMRPATEKGARIGNLATIGLNTLALAAAARRGWLRSANGFAAVRK